MNFSPRVAFSEITARRLARLLLAGGIAAAAGSIIARGQLKIHRSRDRWQQFSGYAVAGRTYGTNCVRSRKSARGNISVTQNER